MQLFFMIIIRTIKRKNKSNKMENIFWRFFCERIFVLGLLFVIIILIFTQSNSFAAAGRFFTWIATSVWVLRKLSAKNIWFVWVLEFLLKFEKIFLNLGEKLLYSLISFGRCHKMFSIGILFHNFIILNFFLFISFTANNIN